MLDKHLLNKKLDMLSDYADTLEGFIAEKESETIRQDRLLLAAVERYFQLLVDLMIDINVHIIREKHLGAPDDLQSTFKTIGENKVIDRVFAEKIAPIVGTRNMLVHRYEKLDTDIFLKNLKKHFSDFKRYMLEIHSFLKTDA